MNTTSSDLPGYLSKHGARHSNDHPNVGALEIFGPQDQILGTRQEYLPTKDKTTWISNDVAGYIDKQYRQTHWDMLGRFYESIKGACKELGDANNQNLAGQNVEVTKASAKSTGFIYNNLVFIDIGGFETSGGRGAELQVKFSQPSELQGMTASQRSNWWLNKNRLSSGTVVCIITANKDRVFCSVTEDPSLPVDPNSHHLQIETHTIQDKDDNSYIPKDVWSDPQWAYLTLKLEEFSDTSIADILELYRKRDDPPRSALFELSNTLGATTKSTCEALQKIAREGDFPFSDYIHPSIKSGTMPNQVPAYARKDDDFSFNLKSAMIDHSDCVLYPNKPYHVFDMQTFKQGTVLDGGQAEALIHTLRSELSCVQGPAGTGKSYLTVKMVEVFRSIQDEAQLGPIIVGAASNQALDELLVKINDQRTVRLGSRSQADFCIKKQLGKFALSRDTLDPQERRRLDSLNGAIKGQTKYCDQLCNRIKQSGSDKTLYKMLAKALQTKHQLCAEKGDLITKMRVQAIRKNETRIVGVTIDGLSSFRELIQRLDAKVMIFEEAGQIAEARSVAGLFQSLEHLVLIGDQQQLRPHVNDNSLSSASDHGKKFSLDRSLLERLVAPDDKTAPKLKYQTLQVQYRMHPEISKFSRNVWASLKDAQSTAEKPFPKGVRLRSSWLDHNVLDSKASKLGDVSDSSDHSMSNIYEAEMACAHVVHLLRQGTYAKGDIGIIVPYKEQAERLRAMLRLTKFPIRVKDSRQFFLAPIEPLVDISTVDGFQGRESKYIILLTVRCNPNGNVGFVKDINRTAVALSRAKDGFLVIGSSQTFLTGGGELWGKVIRQFRQDGLLASKLQLSCSRHPNETLQVQKAADYAKLSPAGGCRQMCGRFLSCGHKCPSVCHSDLLHAAEAKTCQLPCKRVYPGCGHFCWKPCSQKCSEQCSRRDIDEKRVLECGHKAKALPCHVARDPSKAICDEIVLQPHIGCGCMVELPCDAERMQWLGRFFVCRNNHNKPGSPTDEATRRPHASEPSDSPKPWEFEIEPASAVKPKDPLWAAMTPKDREEMKIMEAKVKEYMAAQEKPASERFDVSKCSAASLVPPHRRAAAARETVPPSCVT